MKPRPPLNKGGLQGGFGKGIQPTPALRDRCRCAPPLPRRGSSRELERIHGLLGIDLLGSQIAIVCPVFESLLNLKALQPIFRHLKLGLKFLAGRISQQMVEE